MPPSPVSVDFSAYLFLVTIVILLLLTPTILDACTSMGFVLVFYILYPFLFTRFVQRDPARRLRRMKVEGRARLCRDVAERCRRAAERYPEVGESLRREARYYEWKTRRESRR